MLAHAFLAVTAHTTGRDRHVLTIVPWRVVTNG